MKVVVCIPTYNEKDNIASTIDGIETSLAQLSQQHQVKILVIDDNSPDGTAGIVRQKVKQYGNVLLLPNQQKAGLGAAYIKAFHYAIEKLAAEAVFEFDADGSHQPQYLPGMIQILAQGADVVVGSRYVKGGKMPDNWGMNRKILSYFGNFIARFVLFAPQYTDMTTGFRGTKTKWLKQVDLDKLYSQQFAYKIQLYYELHRLGAKIVEYPIEFIDRSKGKSKFPRNNIVDSLRVVFKLRLRDSQKLIKVMVVGGIGTVVQLGIFNLLCLFLSLSLAQNIAIEAAVVSNFILNNIWTFKETSWSLIRFAKFNILSLGSIVIQNIVLISGVFIFGQSLITVNVLVLIGILLGLIWNYLMYTKVVWKK